MSDDAIIVQKVEEYMEDIVMLDSFWTLYGCLTETSKSGFRKDNWKVSEHFIRYFCIALERNLRLKHDLKKKDVKNVVVDLYDIIKLIRYDSYYDDIKTLEKALRNTVNVMKESAIRMLNMHKLSKLDREILSYFFGILKNKADSLKEEDLGVSFGGYYSKCYTIEAIETKIDRNDFAYWDELFNYLFNRKLKPSKLHIKESKEYVKKLKYLGIFPNVRGFAFSKVFDTIVKFGLGYWCFSLSSSANPRIHVFIPKFAFEIIKKLGVSPIKIDEQTLQKFERQKEIEALLSDMEVEDVEEYTHDEIVRKICLEPEKVEEGLTVLKYEYPTDAGIMDILAMDSKGNYVVIEVKAGKAEHDAVGQIQKYMVWVKENLAKDKGVRGIIIAKEFDRSLLYSIKGSLYPIELKRIDDVI